MTARVIMVQGTASSVGKSVIVAALCRIFRQDGFNVAPFKAQNMALNSFVTREGGEIGLAQAVQAQAAGIEPTVDMNPVLLKPDAEAKSQVIVMGRVAGNESAASYPDRSACLLGVVEAALGRLRAAYEIVVIEGAGSPAEVNLRDHEIVNMRVARLARAPVLLAGDIDRGGVFASLVGTLELLTPEERDLVKGLIINKFRGDVSLLKPGLDFLEAKTGKPVLGVIPFIREVGLGQEDSVYLDERPVAARPGALDVTVIRLPHISNYHDFDPLEKQGCNVRYVGRCSELGTPDLIILPGTKSTIADLDFLRAEKLDRAIVERAAARTPVIGICGGYQMLGRRILDPDSVESSRRSVAGLGLLDTETIFRPAKTTTQVRGRVAGNTGLLEGLRGIEITGYEIHMGQTQSSDGRPALEIVETPRGGAGYFDGSAGLDNLVFGTYLHGLFENAAFTGALLAGIRKQRGLPEALPSKPASDSFDALAKVVRDSVNIPEVYRIMEQG